MKYQNLFCAGILAFSAWCQSSADVITDWNKNMLQAMLTANTSPGAAPRLSAIVQSAVFDAVNGIGPAYEQVHVAPEGPAGASTRAAAIQAAYTTLAALFPPQQPGLDLKRTAALNALTVDEAPQAIAQGVAWGETVALQILIWRSTDGSAPFPTPFLGGSGVGQWRPTPPGNLPGAGPQFATMLPWVIETPSQFRPSGPPALHTKKYTRDFNETRLMGRVDSPLRTADETLFCNFWHVGTATYSWNSLAARLVEEQENSLLDNARLFAHLNLAMADAIIACFDAKYHYVFWRPVTAIPLAGTDPNPATVPDAGWSPLLVTPNHPEYISGHSTISGAGAMMLAHYFGGHTPIWIDSDVMPNVVRVFGSFSSALDEIADARVFGGIHFRTACDDGRKVAKQLVKYVWKNSLRPLHGNRNDDAAAEEEE